MSATQLSVPRPLYAMHIGPCLRSSSASVSTGVFNVKIHGVFENHDADLVVPKLRLLDLNSATALLKFMLQPGIRMALPKAQTPPTGQMRINAGHGISPPL